MQKEKNAHLEVYPLQKWIGVQESEENAFPVAKITETLPCVSSPLEYLSFYIAIAVKS